MISAWLRLTLGSTALAGSTAWAHLMNQVGGEIGKGIPYHELNITHSIVENTINFNTDSCSVSFENSVVNVSTETNTEVNNVI